MHLMCLIKYLNKELLFSLFSLSLVIFASLFFLEMLMILMEFEYSFSIFPSNDNDIDEVYMHYYLVDSGYPTPMGYLGL